MHVSLSLLPCFFLSLSPSPSPSPSPSSLTSQAKLAFERLEVEKEYHPFISGPNNSVIKSITDSTGARVNMPPPSLQKNDITVAGDKDAVAKATAQIMQLYNEMVSIFCSIFINFPRERNLSHCIPLVSANGNVISLFVKFVVCYALAQF
jgi:hypothetical protein